MKVSSTAHLYRARASDWRATIARRLKKREPIM
jgi:hypothetical protein